MNISKNLLKVRGSIKDAKNKLISGEAASHIYLFNKDKTFLAEGLAFISRDLATVRGVSPLPHSVVGVLDELIVSKSPP